MFFLKKYKYFRRKKIVGLNTNFIYNFFFFKCFFGIKSLENGFLFKKELLAFRRVLRNLTRRKLALRMFCKPQIPLTRKRGGFLMGRGRGKFVCYIFRLKKGYFFIEILGFFNFFFYIFLLNKARKKISIKTQLVMRKRRYLKQVWYL